MTPHEYAICASEAQKHTDVDAFVSDLAINSIWGDKVELTEELLTELRSIWKLTHITVREIRAHTGLTQAAFAERFLIPKRTVENWEGGKTECAIYIRKLLAEACGIK